MAKAKTISAKPTKAKISLPLAAAAASGLPEEVINWIPEMTIKITVKKPAMPRIAGKKPVIIWPNKPSANLIYNSGVAIVPKQLLKSVHAA